MIISTNESKCLDEAHGAPTIADRRADARLEIRLPVEIRAADGRSTALVRGITRNISTGGMYLELDEPDLAPGNRFAVRLSIPAAEGVLPYPCRADCEAEVLRCVTSSHAPKGSGECNGIAARFLGRLRFDF